LNFFSIVLGGSSRKTQPVGRLLLILAPGSCRSRTLPVSFTMYGCGTVKVSPYRVLNRIARSRVSSRCCRWSSPTGTWLAAYATMSAACRIG
jgi:hypothetical protein